jgi:hypothetical protein
LGSITQKRKDDAVTRAVKPAPLPRLLRQFWVGSLATLAVTVLVAYIEYRIGFSRFHYNPLTGDRYQDLMEFLPVYRLLHSAAFFDGIGNSRVAYPPFGAVLYAMIYGTGHAVEVYLATAAVLLVTAVWGVRQALRAEGIGDVSATLFPLTVLLTSFPIAGLIQRGNIELYLWTLAATGVWMFFSGRENLAAVLWGMAAALKLYPVILLGLLLPQRKWRAVAVGLGTFVGLSVACMAWIGPSIPVAWHGTVRNVFGYQGDRAAQWSLHELMANHTAYHLAKFGISALHVPLSNLTLCYYLCGAILLGFVFFGRLWKMPVANQLLALTAFMVAFPPVSYFYTLVQLYAPWVVLLFVALRAERVGVEIRGLPWTTLVFLPLFGSFMLFTFPRVFLFGGLVQGALLVLLFLCALQYRFEVPERPAA